MISERRIKEEECGFEALQNLASGRQVEVTGGNLSESELRKMQAEGRRAAFRLYGKARTPSVSILSLERVRKTGLLVEVQDAEGNVYEISCYKSKGGPGHIKKICP